MIFCEQCRIKKNWPRSTGFPLVGTVSNSKCEVCGVVGDSHDIPAVMLVEDKTLEQIAVEKMMQQGYREKAEELVITYVSGSEAGKLNHWMTQMMRGIQVTKNGEIDWYTTHQLRLKVQQEYQKSENIKRDKRTGGKSGDNV